MVGMPENKFIPENWMWLVEIASGLVFIILVSFALHKAVKIFRRKRSPKGGVWQKKADKIVHLPLQIAIWGFGLAYVIDVIGTHYGIDAVERYVRPLKGVFIVACFGWIALRWIKEAFHHLAKKSERLGVSSSTVYALGKLVSFVVSILVLLVIFQMVGLNIVPLLAFGGIGVAGVAFAAQDFIANFFGGAVLHFTRCFSIGDEIVIPSKDNFEGEVREIGWYITVVEDYYRRPVYFPNALFSKTHVINESRRTHRRIKKTVTIRYEDLPKVEAIVAELKEKVQAHPEVDETQSFSVSFFNYSEYGLDLYLYMLVYKMGYLKYLQTKQEVLLIIHEVIEKHGAEVCYPTHNINLTQVPPKKDA